MMDCAARLTVTRGPDQGQAFTLSSELAHIGCGTSNQVILSDPSVKRHQASIVSRNGRFALFTPLDRTVHIDGAEVPADRWVWLPSAAEIELGGQTSVRFEMTPANSNGRDPAAMFAENGAEAAVDPSAFVARKEGSSSTVRRRKRKGEPRRTAARLSVDPHGEPRVQLGADGRLPELNLSESTSTASDAAGAAGPRPWMVVAAVLASSAMSALLLFWSPGASSTHSAAAAREELKAFFGNDGSELAPYQKLLRQAIVEHSQGRLGEERRMYLRALDLLNSADARDARNYNGLTGRQTERGRNSDRELRELLERLVAHPE